MPLRVARTCVNVCGVRVDDVTRYEALELCKELVASRQPAYVTTPNVDCVALSQRDVLLRRAVRESTLSVPDGKGLVLGARIAGVPLREHVPGRWLVAELAREAAAKGWSIYLFGSTETVLRSCVEHWGTVYPTLRVAGYLAPPYVAGMTKAFLVETTEAIRRAKPDIILVALGMPKQEIWMEAARNYGVGGLCLGIGGSLEVIGGQRRTPPEWVNRGGLEWGFRLAQEPRRLWRRYLLRDPWFFFWAVRRRLTRPGPAIGG